MLKSTIISGAKELETEREWVEIKGDSIKLKPIFSFDVFCVAVLTVLGFSAAAILCKIFMSCIARAEYSILTLAGLSFSGALLIFCVGWMFADVFSGVVHYLADQILSPTLYFFGPRFVVPFREHHDEPHGLLKHSFFERSGNNCAVSALLPSLIILHFFISDPLGEASIPTALAWYCCLYGTGLTIALLTAFTNEFHAWAHREHNPKWIMRLQTWGIVLPPSHHDQHHSGNLDSHYCITSGISERLFWRLKRISQMPLFRHDS